MYILFMVVCNTGYAQRVIPLYSSKPPGNITNEDREKFVRPEKGRPSVINVTNPTLTIYLPANPNTVHAAIVICPGGGYLRLTIEDGGYDVAKNLAAAGIATFVLKYRTWQDSAFTSYRDIPMQDLQKAFRIIRDNAVALKIDTTRVGVLGFSAGGHLAAMASVSTSGIKPAFTLLAYPVISFTDSLVSRTLKSRSTLLTDNITQQDKETYSPELHVTATTPPAFIVQAEDDSTSLVGNSLVYYRALVAKRIPAQLLLYQKGGHGFAQYNAAQDEDWLPAAIKWMALNGFYQRDTTRPVAQSLPPFWNDVLAFKKEDAVQPPPANPILLIGSSSFTKWKDIKEYFPGYPLLNRAFGGSVLTDLIRYSNEVIVPYNPKQVLIYCGENDLASSDGVSAAEVVLRFKTLFGIIRQRFPNAVISFVSIKPSPVREKIQPKVKEANKQIKAFLKTQQKTDFIDIYDAMLTKDGKMREELYVQDRLHMKPEGYAIWKKIMMPYLRK